MTGPWIRVEYYNNAGAWVGVTREWLKLGFSRQFNIVPNAPNSNGVDSNAILILQQLRPTLGAGHGAGTQGNFYPINLYDAREGEMRDNAIANVTAAPPGFPTHSATYSSCS